MKTQPQKKILIVDVGDNTRLQLKKHLTALQYHVLEASAELSRLSIAGINKPDMVITELFFRKNRALEILSFMENKLPDTPMIVLSDHAQLENAISMLRLDIWDYMCKPIANQSVLRHTIEKVFEKTRLIKENRDHKNQLEISAVKGRSEFNALETRYRIVADFTHTWEYWVDPEGRMIYISPACRRITGYSPNDFMKNPSLHNDIIHPGDRMRFNKHTEKITCPGNDAHMEYRIVRRDEQMRWISHHCQAVYDEDQKYLGRRGSNQDITSMKSLEIDLRQKQEDLVHKSSDLEKANNALKAILNQRMVEIKSIEQSFVANLKRYVIPYIDSIDRLNTDKTSQSYIQIIRTNIDQLIAPIAQSLSGAYLQFTPTEIKVADLIRRGEPTKSIADILRTSTSTVAIHRNKIRKKLGILNTNTNLQTYLNSLSQ